MSLTRTSHIALLYHKWPGNTNSYKQARQRAGDIFKLHYGSTKINRGITLKASQGEMWDFITLGLWNYKEMNM